MALLDLGRQLVGVQVFADGGEFGFSLALFVVQFLGALQ